MNPRKRKRPTGSSSSAVAVAQQEEQGLQEQQEERWRCTTSPLFQADCLLDEKGPYRSERECLAQCRAVPSDIVRMYTPYLTVPELSALAQTSSTTRIPAERQLDESIKHCTSLLNREKQRLTTARLRITERDNSTIEIQNPWVSLLWYLRENVFVPARTEPETEYMEVYNPDEKEWSPIESSLADNAEEYCKLLYSRDGSSSRILNFEVIYNFDTPKVRNKGSFKSVHLILDRDAIELDKYDINEIDDQSITLRAIPFDVFRP